MAKLRKFGFPALALVGLAFLLAWVSPGTKAGAGWSRFLVVEVLAFGLVWVVLRLIKEEEPPSWLIWAVVTAIGLRLLLAVVWTTALPVWGYPNPQQQAGYPMFDPYLRDGHAWDLARSDQPLLEAFRGYSPHDQYGGLLYLSALLYRLFGGEVHLPLLVVVLGAAASGLGVLFTWGLAKRLFAGPTAKWAAWGLALYPEAILHGSSQMREAFTITLGAALGFILIRLWQQRRWTDGLWLLGLALITAAISWPYLVLVSAVLGLLLFGLILERHRSIRLTKWQMTGVVGLAGVIALAGTGLWRLLSRMSDFQGYLTETASGVVQAVFGRLPEALHTPFMVGYGIVRPLLPAAILGKGNSALWRIIGIWRAAGWTVLLALLLLATLQVIRRRAWLRPAGMLMWGTWLMAVISAYRAGGDLWDNPRYRAGFAVFQLILAAWALRQQQTEKDQRILRRVLIFSSILIGWLLIWYLPRYSAVPWSAGKVEWKVVAGLITGGLYWLWDWRRAHSQSKEHRANP